MQKATWDSIVGSKGKGAILLKIAIKNADVLFWEPSCHTRREDLFIADGVITATGAKDNEFTADLEIDGSGKLVIPGLVNCHTHAYMSVFRNYADDLPFDEWLFRKIMPVEDALTAEDAYWCNLLSCLEMIKTGTTCFADMHMFKNQSVRAAAESGLRAVISRGLVGKTIDDPAAKSRLADAFEEMETAAGNSRISFMLGPHAIYSCGRELLRALPEIAKKKGIGLHIHLAESMFEFDTSMQQNGCSPAAYLDSLGFFEAPVLAAHCVNLTDDDIKILAKHGVSVVTNPVSNMKLGNGFAPVTRLLGAGVNVCVGTDGASSNNALNMFRELSILSYIHKGLEKDVLNLSAGQTLRCGILNGARALGLGDITGSIQTGKRADLVLVDLNKSWLQPVNNPVSSLIYSANGTEPDTVIIDGEVVMEKGQVKTLDEQRILFEVNKIRKRLI
ncbi:MAG: amidohydrolase [Treponema sp.]|nr:amidohydrolase [Treponema sp.]